MLLHAVEDAIRERGPASVADQLLEGDDTKRLIGLALHRNASVLVVDPTLTLPCVYALCWFEDLVGVRSVISGWRREWRSMTRGPWLRSLRPPMQPLGGPLVQEFLGPTGAFTPWFSDDGTVIGLRNETEVLAWSRATGRRLTDTRPPLLAPERYHIDNSNYENATLALIETATGERLSVRIDEGLSIGCLTTLADGDILAGGWFLEYGDGVILRMCPRSGDIRWRTDMTGNVTEIGLSQDGSHAVVSARGQHVVSSATGEVIEQFPAAAGSATLSPDQTQLAAWNGTCLRVWTSGTPDAPESKGLVATRFSPNGGLLLCGSNLVNGMTGELIAQLNVESTGYLEGGPAPGCTQVLDDGVIEAGMFRGFQRWDAAGVCVLDDQQRRYSVGRHSLAFTSDGDLYTVAPNRLGDNGVIEIRRSADGEVLRVINRASTGVVAWSPRERLLINLSAAGEVYATPVTGHERSLGHHASADHICFSIDGAFLATADYDGTERLWSLATGEIDHRPAQLDFDGPWSVYLQGWHGVSFRRHDLAGQQNGGVFEIHDQDGLLAGIPSDDPLTPSPSGTHWANRTCLFELSDDTS